MDDALVVRVFERLGHLQQRVFGFLRWQRSFGDAFGEGRALHQLHDEGVFFDAVDGGDARVIERRQHLGFAREAGQALGVVGESGRQHFDGDFATAWYRWRDRRLPCPLRRAWR